MMNPITEQTWETIAAMRQQEEHPGYNCTTDYLSDLPQPSTTITLNITQDTPVDASCRSVMAQWCMEIANFCKYEKETVAIAMNCLDRFMSTPTGKTILLDRHLYQLASMTALYTSVKIHEPEVMDSKLVSSLSRGVHTADAVEAMERTMLHAIGWRVNPCTVMSFVRLFLQQDFILEKKLLNSLEQESLLDLTSLQVEMVEQEYNFCYRSTPSQIAVACLWNAIEICCPNNVPYFQTIIGKKTLRLNEEVVVQELRIAINELVNNNSDNRTNCIPQQMKATTTTPTMSASSSLSSSVGMTTTTSKNVQQGRTIRIHTISPRTVAINRS